MKNKKDNNVDKEVELYEIAIKCENCLKPNIANGETWWVKIPKGIISDDFLKERKCEYCGCKTLKRM